MTDVSPYALPHLEEIFQKLCRGRHICAEDGTIYHALHDNAASFVELFNHLGFHMETHPRDFYYFRGGKSLSETSARMALFIFILMEHLEGQCEPVEESMLTKKFSIDELPHFNKERYRLYMKESGVEDIDALAGVINSLEKFGFALQRGDSFRFRAPVYRFFDICHTILKQDQTTTPKEESV
jgi:hypothetical protein